MLKPVVEIQYCPGCHWLPRSAWMAQELLFTFSDELHGVTLVPSSQSGFFCIYLNGEVLWDRKTEGGFPEIRELKQRVRDCIAPQRNLGHLDK